MSRWVHQSLLIQMPLPNARPRAKQNTELAELLGSAHSADEAEEDTASEASRGNDGDAEACAEVEMQDNVAPPKPPARKPEDGPLPRARAWVRMPRQGMCSEAWLTILNSLTPGKIVLVTPFGFQAGLLMATLRYNQPRYGLSKCVTVIFHPGSKQAEASMLQDGTRTKDARKALAGHIADHTIMTVVEAYEQYIGAAERIATRATLSNTKNVALVTTGRRLLKRNSSHADGAGGGGRINNVIMLTSNDKKDQLLVLPDHVDNEDSDNDDGQSPCDVLSSEVVSKRNQSALTKVGVKVQRSSYDAAGNGLFAARNLAKGTEIGVKGPIFSDKAAAESFIESLPPISAASFVQRVIHLRVGVCSTPPEAESRFMVMALVARNSRLKLALRFAFQTLRFETRVSVCVSFCVSRDVACDPCVFSYAFQKRVWNSAFRVSGAGLLRS